jgi:outer membrane protein
VGAAALILSAAPVRAQALHLSLKDAESRALQNHPQIRASQEIALAAGEAVREIRSAYFPTAVASFTGAQAMQGTRIAAGGLNNPTILDRFAYGFSAAQLLTDFGRTPALTASAGFRADADEKDVDARRADVLLQVDRAYFEALRSQAILRVAQQTVATRQLVVDQVSALASSGLKSTLDLSFARVNLAEAQLLLEQATNDVQAGYAGLSAALGAPQTTTYDLADEPLPPPPPPDSGPLIAEALQNRPDVASLRFTEQASQKYAAAERARWFPTLSLVGAAGMTPYHQFGLNDRYSAVGINVSVPLTNGNLFQAQRAEANFRANADEQRLQDMQNRVTRDVRIAWLDAETAYKRLDLTAQLLAEARDAADLAQQRYNLGLSSIVELTQAQLNQTQADIQESTARYEYAIRDAALRYQRGLLK